MQILHIAPLIESLTEKIPGGGEQGALNLAIAQKEAGHNVSMICAKGSRLPVGIRAIDLDIPPGRLKPIQTSLCSHEVKVDFFHLCEVQSREEEIFGKVESFLLKNRNTFNIVHNHAYDRYPLFDLERVGIPLIHSLQLPPIIAWINDRFRKLPLSQSYIAPSHAMAKLYEDITGFKPKVIYYGINLREIPFVERPEDHFIWVGRISKEKGLHTAIELFQHKPDQRLIVIGRIYDSNYFEQLKPKLSSSNIHYLGHLPHEKVLDEMGRAKALLFPIEWDEPFGLVVAESLAAGTPVISFRRGAMSEIIRDGETGFLAMERAGLENALDRVDSLSRYTCRKSVEERFSVEVMMKGYLAEYENLIAFTKLMKPS